MFDINQKFLEIIKSQQELLDELEKELLEAGEEDFKEEIEGLRLENAELKSEVEKLLNENKIILGKQKNLQKQLEDIKTKKLKFSSFELFNKYNSLLNRIHMNYINESKKISSFETESKLAFERMRNYLNQNHISKTDEIYQEFNEYKKSVSEKIDVLKEEQKKIAEENKSKIKNEYKELRSQTSPIKQGNDIEKFIGLNVLNKAGAAFIVLAVILGSVYTYSNILFSPIGRCLFAFTLGIIMILMGEFFNRKKLKEKNVFSTGLISGGIAVLYIGIFITYYYSEEIFGRNTAFLPIMYVIFALLTISVFVMSLYYNSRTISVFGLTGSYLSVISIYFLIEAISPQAFYLYFLLINSLVVFLSLKKSWSITYFFALFFNSIIFLEMYFCQDLNYLTVALIYLSWVIHLVSPLISRVKLKLAVKKSDYILVFLNTLISSFYIYVYLEELHVIGTIDFTIVGFMLIAIILLLLGIYFEKNFEPKSRIISFLYLTSLTYLFLCVPIGIGFDWAPFVFVVEVSLVYLWGILKDDEIYKKYGYIAYIIFSVIFMYSNSFFILEYRYSKFNDPMDLFLYATFTAGLIAIVFGYRLKNIIIGEKEMFLKYFALLNFYIFAEYTAGFIINRYMLNTENFVNSLIIYLIKINLTFAVCFIIGKASFIRDEITDKFRKLLFGFALIKSVFVLLPSYGVPQVQYGMNIFVIILMAVLICVYTCRFFNGLQRYDIGIIVTAVAFVLLNKTMFFELNFQFDDFIVSIAYALSALIMVGLGFMRNQKILRRFGLGLSVLASVKIFIFDFNMTTMESKIFSYFLLGVCLLLISFLYQFFSKKRGEKN